MSSSHCPKSVNRSRCIEQTFTIQYSVHKMMLTPRIRDCFPVDSMKIISYGEYSSTTKEKRVYHEDNEDTSSLNDMHGPYQYVI